LKRENIPCPESALPEDKDEFIERVGFPIVVKPREGHGSIHFNIANDPEELQFAISRIKKSNLEPLLQEFLRGDDSEFTTGVTLDKTGSGVQSSIAMRRILKHGQTYKAFIEDYPKVRETAEQAALRFGAEGPINAQSRIAEGLSKIFEINPRFSASCPIRAIAGVNEPDLVFRSQVLGESLSIPAIEKNLVALRYWNEVYVPYSSFRMFSELGESTSPESFIPDYF
jgi:carbamoyl-phosphate synthase large subunit